MNDTEIALANAICILHGLLVKYAFSNPKLELEMVQLGIIATGLKKDVLAEINERCALEELDRSRE